MKQTPSASFVIGSFQKARRKTMSKDGCRKIAAMHVALNAGIKYDKNLVGKS